MGMVIFYRSALLKVPADGVTGPYAPEAHYMALVTVPSTLA